MLQNLKNKINSSPQTKKMVQFLTEHPYLARPRWWVRVLIIPFLIKKKKGAVIRRNTRMDIFPYQPFEMGERAVIESFATVNNGVGPVILGDRSRIGIGCTVIGPVRIGNDVQLAQNITISGLNHSYSDIAHTINSQKVTTAEIIIEDDVWIGANSVIVAGVKIGNHCVIAGGSVVTRSIPSYSVCAGNPARIIKQYDRSLGQWIKIQKDESN